MPISYYAPYDSAVAPAKAALEAYSRGERLGKNELQKLADGGFTFIGKLAQPFVEEALLSERIADVVSVAGFGRGGRRRTGAEIYKPTDNPGEKIVKSMQHILGAMNPSIVDNFVTIKPGQGLVTPVGYQELLKTFPVLTGKTLTSTKKLWLTHLVLEAWNLTLKHRSSLALLHTLSLETVVLLQKFVERLVEMMQRSTVS